MKLQFNDYVNIVTTALILAAFAKQIMILLYTDWEHPTWSVDIFKILFPLFNIAIVVGMWLPYINEDIWSSICFLAAGIIAAYTYWSPIFNNKK